MSFGLYWCTTQYGESDYWVLAETARSARVYFGEIHGFCSKDVRATRVKTLSIHWVLDAKVSSIPCDPTKDQLALFEVHYNSNFHVFYIGSKIYRPENMARALRITTAKLALKARLRGQKRTNAFLW